MGHKQRQLSKNSAQGIRRKSKHAHENTSQARRIDALLEMAEEERLRRNQGEEVTVLGPRGGVHHHFYRPTNSPAWKQCKCGRFRQVIRDE